MSPGQLLVVGFRPQEEGEILSLVERGRLGGLILFGRNGQDAMETVRVCGALRDAALQGNPAVMPLVAVDQEQGRICRILHGVTLFPGAGVLGKMDRPRTTGRVARWVGREMASLGVHLNLAPVADVSLGDSPSRVLADRTFGHDAARVARHVGAWIRGSQGAGTAACAKHFPGHGSVTADSHTELPTDPTPLGTMLHLHLKPFSAAIRAGVAVVMVGHVAYEALDPGVPASLSASVIEGVLRAQMGFAGLVLTDDLEMEAVAQGRDPARAVLEAIRAGADMALVGRNLRGEIGLKDLVGQVETASLCGTLPRDRMEGAFARIAAFKRQWIPLRWERPSRAPSCSRAQNLANRLWSLDPEGGS